MASEESLCVFCFLDAVTYTSVYLHTFIGCDKTPVFAQAFANSKIEWKGMMYNVAYSPPACRPFTCTSQAQTVASQRDSDVLQRSWAQTGLGGGFVVTTFSQRLLVVQHHGVCSLSTDTTSVLQKGCRRGSTNGGELRQILCQIVGRMTI